jgi:hypothetical protein
MNLALQYPMWDDVRTHLASMDPIEKNILLDTLVKLKREKKHA